MADPYREAVLVDVILCEVCGELVTRPTERGDTSLPMCSPEGLGAFLGHDWVWRRTVMVGDVGPGQPNKSDVAPRKP